MKCSVREEGLGPEGLLWDKSAASEDSRDPESDMARSVLSIMAALKEGLLVASLRIVMTG